MFKIIFLGRNNLKIFFPSMITFVFLLTLICTAFVESAPRDRSSDRRSAQARKDLSERELKTLDLLSRIDAFSEEDEKLRTDAAKAHYNMGNIYFYKGEYRIAAREYYQAVALMPNDPDAHYNLAFVSDEYLQDYKTALKHYRLYLYLNPNAKDTHFVKEHILKISLYMNSKVDSPLGDD